MIVTPEPSTGKVESTMPKTLPYVVRVNENMVTPLLNIMGKNGLKNIITKPDRYLKRAKKNNLKFSHEERTLLEEMSHVNEMLRNEGRITDASKFMFRYVRVPLTELNKTVE